MGSSTTGTIVGIIIGFIATLGIAFVILYITAMNILPLVGPGLVPPNIASAFLAASILEQLNMVYTEFLLNIIAVYILAPVIWLIGGLLGGLIVRDMMKGAAAGLISAIIAPFVALAISWVLSPGFNFDILLNWVINGILAGLIAAVGGVIGGTLTSQIETH